MAYTEVDTLENNLESSIQELIEQVGGTISSSRQPFRKKNISVSMYTQYYIFNMFIGVLIIAIRI